MEDHWTGAERNADRIADGKRIAEPAKRRKRNKFFAGMHEDPFSFIANPRFYYFSRAHQDVFNSLRSMVLEGRGLVCFLHIRDGKDGADQLPQRKSPTHIRHCHFPWLF